MFGSSKNIFFQYLILLIAKSDRCVIHKDRFPNGVMAVQIPLFHSCIQCVISAHYITHQPLQRNRIKMVTWVGVEYSNIIATKRRLYMLADSAGKGNDPGFGFVLVIVGCMLVNSQCEKQTLNIQSGNPSAVVWSGLGSLLFILSSEYAVIFTSVLTY